MAENRERGTGKAVLIGTMRPPVSVLQRTVVVRTRRGSIHSWQAKDLAFFAPGARHLGAVGFQSTSLGTGEADEPFGLSGKDDLSLTLFSPFDFFVHHPLTRQGLAQLLPFFGDPVHRVMHIIGIS